MADFHAEILSPYGAVIDTEASYIDAPGSLGRFGIMAGHAPMVASLAPGLLSVRLRDGREEKIAVTGGVLAVHKEKVTVLARTAETSRDIDLGRAEAARERARRRLHEKSGDTDMARAREALARAAARISVASLR